MKAVEMGNLSTFYDSQNYYFFNGYSQKETLEKLYPYICDQMHVKDGPGMDGKGGIMSGALLGQGDSDFAATADILKENKFSGWLILENYYYMEPLRSLGYGQFGALDQDVKYLKSLFG